MLPLALGVLETVDSALVMNIIRYGLTVLIGTYFANNFRKEAKRKKKDVFSSKAKVDVLSSESVEVRNVSEKKSKELSVSDNNSLSDSWSSSIGGSSLLEVLSNSGKSMVEGFRRVESSIREGFRRVSLNLEALRFDLQRLEGEQFDIEQLIKVLQGLGTLLGAIGLSLEGIRTELSNLNLNTEIKLPDLFRVRLENEKLPIEVLNDKLPVALPAEVVDSAVSTKRVMDILSTPISVNPNGPLTRGTPIEIISHSAGVQAKTFADINSFEVDGDIPDLPGSVDLSKIFQFLKVSSQLGGGSL